MARSIAPVLDPGQAELRHVSLRIAAARDQSGKEGLAPGGREAPGVEQGGEFSRRRRPRAAAGRSGMSPAWPRSSLSSHRAAVVGPAPASTAAS